MLCGGVEDLVLCTFVVSSRSEKNLESSVEWTQELPHRSHELPHSQLMLVSSHPSSCYSQDHWNCENLKCIGSQAARQLFEALA